MEYSEEQYAEAMKAAEKDILWAVERVERLAAGLRRYATLGTSETRAEKIATLCSTLNDTFDAPQQNLMLGVAITLIAESEMELKVAEDEGFIALTQETEKFLRR